MLRRRSSSRSRERDNRGESRHVRVNTLLSTAVTELPLGGRRDVRPAWLTGAGTSEFRAEAEAEGRAAAAAAAANSSSSRSAFLSRGFPTTRTTEATTTNVESDKWGIRKTTAVDGGVDAPPIPLERANFGLSGALARDVATGNTVNGVVLKFSEPLDARAPDRRWRMYVFKGVSSEPIATLYLHRKSVFLFGRDEAVADVPIQHPSASKQHAVIQFRSVPLPSIPGDMGPIVHSIKPYLMDLESSNGTFLNGEKIVAAR